MKAENIRVDDVLELRRERQEAYGMDSPYVQVSAIHCKNGYKTPWIYDTDGAAYKPSDFKNASQC